MNEEFNKDVFPAYVKKFFQVERFSTEKEFVEHLRTVTFDDVRNYAVKNKLDGFMLSQIILVPLVYDETYEIAISWIGKLARHEIVATELTLPIYHLSCAFVKDIEALVESKIKQGLGEYVL